MENDRKTQIIKAAVKRFSKHGLGKTTLDEIARDLRIGKATIYHYFISKEELFYSAIEWECEQYIEEVKAVFDNSELSLREKLNSYFNNKGTLDQRYKLLYDLFLVFMKEDIFEKEKEILQSTLMKEKAVIESVLNHAYRKKEIKLLPSLHLMFLVMSWGWPLGFRLLGIVDGENESQSDELLSLLIENILPD